MWQYDAHIKLYQQLILPLGTISSKGIGNQGASQHRQITKLEYVAAFVDMDIKLF